MVHIRRKASKHASYSYRWNSLCSKELRQQRYLRKLLLISALQAEDELNAHDPDRLLMFETIALQYAHRYYQRSPLRTRKQHVAKTFDDFSDMDCWIRFRTRKIDLPRLLRAFKLDRGPYVASNGTKFTGEEILMIGLHRYCCVGTLHVTMSKVFDMDYSMLSRALSVFNKHMLRFHKHLLVDNIQYWKNYFDSFAEKIPCKFIEFGVHYPPGTFRVVGFYDDTVLATCRPGSGPNKDGSRKSNYNEMAFYYGWKKHHDIKYQTLAFPNGMCGDIYGPCTFKAHDCDLLRDSQLNQRLAALQQGDPIEYCVYGDGIFPLQSHTMGKHVGNLTRRSCLKTGLCQRSVLPTSVTDNFYPYVKYKYAQKILKSKMTVNTYVIATLVRNSHCCLYEGLTASYFDLHHH
jgi:hypothetical protein